VGAAAALGFAPGSVLAAGRAGLLATDDAALADRARLLRSHGMTSGSWSRHTGQTAGYDVVALGFNHRPDEPRAALVTSRWRRLEAEVGERRELTWAYRAALEPLAPALRPAFAEASVGRSSCAAMVVLLGDARRRDEVRRSLLAVGRVRTGTLPAAPADGAPRARQALRAALALPLLPALGAAGVERVVGALAAALPAARAR
jgi:dTDP-4-amino-4,6-dideoxygalactose transaminase